MTNVQKELIQTTIPRYCKFKGVSMDNLAVKVGVGHNIILKMAKGMWDGIDNKYFRRVWVEIDPSALEGIFQTEDCKSVFDLCTSAIAHKRMIGLTGDTGMGKSTALKAFAVRANVFYYYVDSTVTVPVFLKGLLQEMGIYFDGNTNEMLERIVSELNMLSDPLLIIDECGKLKDKMILTLHSLRDQTIKNAGIVLAGMPAFKNGLIKKRNQGVNGYSEFFRRVNLWHELKGLSAQEITYVLVENGIADKEEQQEFRRLTQFGDLINAINLHKTLNN